MTYTTVNADGSFYSCTNFDTAKIYILLFVTFFTEDVELIDMFQCKM